MRAPRERNKPRPAPDAAAAAAFAAARAAARATVHAATTATAFPTECATCDGVCRRLRLSPSLGRSLPPGHVTADAAQRDGRCMRVYAW